MENHHQKTNQLLILILGKVTRIEEMLAAKKTPRPHNTPNVEGDAELEKEAMKIFHERGYASASLLQREMSIGYQKASRVVENLERKGLVGKPNQSRKNMRELIES